MKKANRKLIPAVVMLLVSAIMLSTASFAWFSMNNQVTVNGMTIEAETNEVFFQIGKDKAADGEFATNLTYEDKNPAKLNPTFPGLKQLTAEGDADNADFKLPKDSTTELSAIVWSYATSNDFQNKAGTVFSLVGDIEAAKSGNYVEHHNFDIRLLNNTTNKQGCKVASVTLEYLNNKEQEKQALANALRVLVVGQDGYEIWSFDGNATTAQQIVKKGNLLCEDIPVKAEQYTPGEIDVYIYFDGNSASCTSEKALLTTGGYKISFALDAVAGEARP